MNWLHRHLITFAICGIIMFLTGCSATKFVPEDKYMLAKNTIVSDDEEFNEDKYNDLMDDYEDMYDDK